MTKRRAKPRKPKPRKPKPPSLRQLIERQRRQLATMINQLGVVEENVFVVARHQRDLLAVQKQIEALGRDLKHVRLLAGQLIALTGKSGKTGVAAVDHYLDMEHRVWDRGINGLTEAELKALLPMTDAELKALLLRNGDAHG